MIIPISITINDIERAEISRLSDGIQSTSCPIARAINRCEYLSATSVGRIGFCTTVMFANKIYDIPLPQIAIDFIQRFDSLQFVDLIDFEIEIPDDAWIKETRLKIIADTYQKRS